MMMTFTATMMARTPIWVFALFFLLLAVGYSQTRERRIRRWRLIVLPVAMVCLSFHGIASSFGGSLLSMAYWGVGLLLPTARADQALGRWRPLALPDCRSFLVPGSWRPLGVMMSIFTIKYVLGVCTALDLPVRHESWFVAIASLFLGVLSGWFVASAVRILRTPCEKNPSLVTST